MSSGQDDAAPQEIIIVRRKGGDGDGGHHGGAWKIAYADFMTAMMALFLVMWLVNSASDDMKSQVATYFNPMKLSDPTYVPKGVKQMDTKQENETQSQAPTKGKSSDSKDVSQEAGDTPEAVSKSLQDMFELRESDKTNGETSRDPDAETAAISGPASERGEAFRDPFDPSFRSSAENKASDSYYGEEFDFLRHGKRRILEPGVPSEDKDRLRKSQNVRQDEEGISSQQSADPVPGEGFAERAMIVLDQSESEADVHAGAVGEDGERQTEVIQEARVALEEKKKKEKKKEEAKKDAKEVAAEIRKLIESFAIPELPNVTVVPEQDGVLISLTDTANFGMFAISSARPNPNMVKLMRQLSAILKKRQGTLIVRGHTDARPFKSKKKDNWQLSALRAHSAYNMLLGSGIPKVRFGRIEGYASQRLKNKEDPFAAQNRRIEIFLRKDDA